MSRMLLAWWLLVVAALPAAEPLPYTGVNMAGADFGEGSLPGTYGVDYTYPTADEFAYFAGKGMTIIRLPFRWERLQRSLEGDFHAAEWSRLQTAVSAARAERLTVILDPHNYARYHGDLIGSTAVPTAAFADFWSRLAGAYAGDTGVWFGIMNEPYGIDASDWLPIANAAIAAIRDAGASNTVLVPGTAWTGAHSWSQDWYGTPNASAMTGVVDSGDNFLIEVHQYLDADASGTTDGVVSATIGSERVAGFTAWCRDHGLRAFLGEFAGPRSELSDQAIADLLTHLEANDDVWVGWTWWAAGPWWGDYIFTLEPDGETDRPQMINLEPHLTGNASDPVDPVPPVDDRRSLRLHVPGAPLPVTVELAPDSILLTDPTDEAVFERILPVGDLRVQFGTAVTGDG